ncbi:hypothetical protein B0H14DRAFT_3606730 [Mycena olivaceomarginata]|nr:hypothetical protein B0H14DRAFT_3606730 [Mycena olivaceomarginata]
MAPKSSSASSGTRKKHARKAAGQDGGADQGAPQHPPQRGEKKGKKHRSDPPRPKVYIAPVKPTARNPDPLDAVPGLAQRLPPALLVILRSLGKKAMVTKVRALEELGGAGWVGALRDEDGVALYALRDALPVWLHHLPAHLVHPARRAAEDLRPLLVDDAPELARECRAVAAAAAIAASARAEGDSDSLLEFLERVILHPDAVYAELSPPAPAHVPDTNSAHAKGAKHPQSVQLRPTGVAPASPTPGRSRGDEADLESPFDRRARLRIAAFGALRANPRPSPSPPFLASPALWSALQHSCAATPILAVALPGDAYTEYLARETGAPPVASSEGVARGTGAEGEDAGDTETDTDTLPLGRAQPALRRAAWALVGAVLARGKARANGGGATAESESRGDAETTEPAVQQRQRHTLPRALPLALAHTLLPALWAEADAGVQQGQGGMWRGGLGFLGAHPEAWGLAPEEGDFGAFLSLFLARACNSSAANTAAAETGYAAMVVVLGSVRWEILVTHREALFAAFWAALGRSLTYPPVRKSELLHCAVIGDPELISDSKESHEETERKERIEEWGHRGQLRRAGQREGEQNKPEEENGTPRRRTYTRGQPENNTSGFVASHSKNRELEQERRPARDRRLANSNSTQEDIDSFAPRHFGVGGNFEISAPSEP